MDILDPTQRHMEPEIGAVGSSLARVETKGIDVDARTVRARASAPELDRYEEIVLPSAFRDHLPTFEANPVLCAGHTYSGENGEATTIGHWRDMAITDDALDGTAHFARTGLAEDYWQLYAGQHMRAFSVGWLTHAFEMLTLDELSRKYGTQLRAKPKVDDDSRRYRVFTQVELIEISAVSIPANRAALVRAAGLMAGAIGGESRDAATDDALSTMIQRAVDEALKAHLSPLPGSTLCGLIQDVIDATRGTEGFVGTGLDAPHHASATDADAELKAKLQELVTSLD